MPKRFLRQLGLYFVLIFISFVSLFPFYWSIVTSLKIGKNLFKTEWVPSQISIENYKKVLLDQPFSLNLVNSVLIAVTTVGVSLLIGIFAAYSLARHRFRGRKFILYSFLIVSMFPQIAILSGLFEVLRFLGLFNHRLGLSCSYLIFTLPFTVWSLMTFMRELPKEMEESAILDGAGTFVIIFKIILPLLTPSLITTGLLAFIAAWNEFFFALTFSVTNQSKTVPVAIALMTGASEHEVPWGMIMAASVMVTIPVVVFAMACQKRIVSGLTAGALKG